MKDDKTKTLQERIDEVDRKKESEADIIENSDHKPPLDGKTPKPRSMLKTVLWVCASLTTVSAELFLIELFDPSLLNNYPPLLLYVTAHLFVVTLFMYSLYKLS